MTCAECKYFEAYDLKKGWCHRFPPTFSTRAVDGQCEGDTGFPFTTSDEWCGEFASNYPPPKKYTVDKELDKVTSDHVDAGKKAARRIKVSFMNDSVRINPPMVWWTLSDFPKDETVEFVEEES